MGLFSRATTVAAFEPVGINNIPSGVFSASTLPVALLPDVDVSTLPVTIEQAWTVPGVARALALYSSLASRLPLLGAPFITTKGNGAFTPGLTISTCVQDMVLIGAAVLQVERDADGYVSNAERIHPSRWSLTPEGHVAIDGKVVADTSVVYVPSLLPFGFLQSGRESVRHAVSLARTVAQRSATPQPATLVQPTGDFSGSIEEIEELVDSLADIMTHGRGGILYVPKDITVSDFGGSDSVNQLLIEARDAARTDIANFLGLSASLLDGTRSGSAETYSNALQQSNELLELSLKQWTEPFADRLSQDDVTPPGTRVRFDYSAFDAISDAAGNVGAPRPNNPLNGDNRD